MSDATVREMFPCTHPMLDDDGFCLNCSCRYVEHICRDGYADWGSADDCITCGGGGQ